MVYNRQRSVSGLLHRRSGHAAGWFRRERQDLLGTHWHRERRTQCEASQLAVKLLVLHRFFPRLSKSPNQENSAAENSLCYPDRRKLVGAVEHRFLWPEVAHHKVERSACRRWQPVGFFVRTRRV